MIQLVEGPLIQQPSEWILVFDTRATTPFLSRIPFGRYKHVRAYTYVPFLHVWLFFDPHWGGTDLIATGGDVAPDLIRAWVSSGQSDLMHVRFPRVRCPAPWGGWCVPQIKRLLGIRCGALRPDALWRHCLAHGGKPIEQIHERRRIATASDNSGGADGRQGQDRAAVAGLDGADAPAVRHERAGATADAADTGCPAG